MEAKKPDNPTTRRVKNPETFRERALKVSSSKETESRSSKILKAPFRGLAALFRPLAKLLKRLKKVKALKPLFIILSFIGRIIVPKYIRSSFAELKQVNWPNFRLSLRLTYAVLVFAIIFGSAVAVLDYGLGKVFKNILLK